MKNHKTDPEQWFVDEVLPHEDDLRSWLSERFSSVRDVDDLVQEAFSHLLKAHESGPVVDPRASLFVVTRNPALNHLRHLEYERPLGSRGIDPLSIMDEVTSTPESIALREEFKILIEAIQSWPERCRQVMTLRKRIAYFHKHGISARFAK